MSSPRLGPLDPDLKKSPAADVRPDSSPRLGRYISVAAAHWDIMRYQNNRFLHRCMQIPKLLLRLCSRDRIERAERLIHEQGADRLQSLAPPTHCRPPESSCGYPIRTYQGLCSAISESRAIVTFCRISVLFSEMQCPILSPLIVICQLFNALAGIFR